MNEMILALVLAAHSTQVPGTDRHVPPRALVALCSVESDFKANRINLHDHPYTVGLCGLSEAAAKDGGFKDHPYELFQPAVNAKFAAHRLAKCIKKYKRFEDQGNCYNRFDFKKKGLATSTEDKGRVTFSERTKKLRERYKKYAYLEELP